MLQHDVCDAASDGQEHDEIWIEDLPAKERRSDDPPWEMFHTAAGRAGPGQCSQRQKMRLNQRVQTLVMTGEAAARTSPAGRQVCAASGDQSVTAFTAPFRKDRRRFTCFGGCQLRSPPAAGHPMHCAATSAVSRSASGLQCVAPSRWPRW
jgi:hypothetical protein